MKKLIKIRLLGEISIPESPKSAFTVPNTSFLYLPIYATDYPVIIYIYLGTDVCSSIIKTILQTFYGLQCI